MFAGESSAVDSFWYIWVWVALSRSCALSLSLSWGRITSLSNGYRVDSAVFRSGSDIRIDSSGLTIWFHHYWANFIRIIRDVGYIIYILFELIYMLLNEIKIMNFFHFQLAWWLSICKPGKQYIVYSQNKFVNLQQLDSVWHYINHCTLA